MDCTRWSGLRRTDHFVTNFKVYKNVDNKQSIRHDVHCNTQYQQMLGNTECVVAKRKAQHDNCSTRNIVMYLSLQLIILRWLHFYTNIFYMTPTLKISILCLLSLAGDKRNAVPLNLQNAAGAQIQMTTASW